ncbi:unnamed protein product [Danaus chrysippus]|uniref:(African queen) hypothetical protein n=1 Tax=Danaus chrysippus TaxID=151541 RepID=A0A8J2QA07_9NEOP|nr:unnamed protein product [Danaus chrysippus]
MNESKAYSSLFALVDSHLSKTSVNESNSVGSHNEIQIPSLNGLRTGSLSETWLSQPPTQRLPIPTLNSGESPITNVLAEQVANMLKAKEKKQEEEKKQKLEEELKKLKIEDEKNSVIDLMKALQTSYHPEPMCHSQDILSSSSSFESLFELKFTDCDKEPEKTKTPEPLLPCTTDLSYVLKNKVKKAKCSKFGKVVAAKLCPVALVYLRENIDTTITRFRFDTISPCDAIKEKLRRPTISCTYTVSNIM